MSSLHGWTLSDDSDSGDDTSLLSSRISKSADSTKRCFASPAHIKQKLKDTAKRLHMKLEDNCTDKFDGKDLPESASSSGNCRKANENIEADLELPAKRLKPDDASRDPLTVWAESCPLNYLLSTVTGLPDQFNYHHPSTPIGSLHIRDILSEKFGPLIETAQFNYCINVAWFLEQLPSEKRKIPILFVHGDRGADYSDINKDSHPNIKTCKVDLPPYGTHHTKMMLLRYHEGLRIVIHTCNLVAKDWHQKTQGLWISPLFNPLKNKDVAVKDHFCFKTDIIEYLRSYKRHSVLEKWIDLIQQHDLSAAKVVLIGSVPGRHKDNGLRKWGHTRLEHVLKQYVKNVSGWPVIGQFSSIGSLGMHKDKWLCSEWLKSMSSSKVEKFGILGVASNASLKLIFPTVENIRMSLEGYPAGASVPYNVSVAKKQIWLDNFLHNWKSRYLVRTQASPHIKTYTRVNKDYTKASWFLLTSSNLSKAAWGSLEKKNTQLAIKSYELGVLFLPQRIFSDETKLSFDLKSADGRKPELVLPYSTPLVPYSETDQPWIWDVAHKSLPDRHGNMWVPS